MKDKLEGDERKTKVKALRGNDDALKVIHWKIRCAKIENYNNDNK